MLDGLAGLLLIAVAVVVVLVFSSGGGGPSYANQAKVALRPVIGANNQLTGSLSTLVSPNSGVAARSTVLSTLSTVQAAQQKLSTLKPGSGDERFAGAAQAALSSERSFLNAADAVLGNPFSPSVDDLATLGNDTNTKLLALDVDVPGASASFPGGSAISTWAQLQTAAASTTALLRAFASKGDSLLSPRPHFRQSTRCSAKCRRLRKAVSRASRSRKRRQASAR
jgi:citrate synthase